ncbi:A24 family peptidase [Qipengyuania marisflavi]|uniref:Peptidase n=1 Tax=Qipengyuania marisflavi TaxID=2486356 RepID=A0A5S3PBZ6_9SPHN|nr:prepilin peptidase [Qipengyuania marisflavi]TMM48759.1 peptidase [Qipengyuania marisflavi]
MPDQIFTYGLLGALAIALLIAAFTDFRHRKIANWLNGAIALGAPLFWWASGLSLYPGVTMQLGVALATFAVCCVLFAVRQMGGGDVKLLTALALWVPPAAFFKLILLMALIGGVLTIVFGGWHIMRRRKDRIAIPYGLAIATSGLWVLGTEPFALAGVTGTVG